MTMLLVLQFFSSANRCNAILSFGITLMKCFLLVSPNLLRFFLWTVGIHRVILIKRLSFSSRHSS
jgi:hypothetical protein